MANYNNYSQYGMPNNAYGTSAYYDPRSYAPMPQQSNQGIIWVQGEAGAKSYMVGPGQNVLLMDSEGSCFYIKSSDASGMPLPLRVFDYTERVQQRSSYLPGSSEHDKYVTRDEFEALKASLAGKKENWSNGE